MTLPTVGSRSVSRPVLALPPGFDQLRRGSDLAATVAGILWRSARVVSPVELLASALPEVAHDLRAEYASVVSLADGVLRVMSAHGPARAVPQDLLSDALDRETSVVSGGWAVAP